MKDGRYSYGDFCFVSNGVSKWHSTAPCAALSWPDISVYSRTMLGTYCTKYHPSLNYLIYFCKVCTRFLEHCVSWWAKCWQRATHPSPQSWKIWLMLSGFTSVLWCGYRLWNKLRSIPRPVYSICLFCCHYHQLHMKFVCTAENKILKNSSLAKLNII
jgi:hypothetical protein